MSRDRERLIETVNELWTRICHLLSDMVPPPAQVHLLNAHRDLISAMLGIIGGKILRRLAQAMRVSTYAQHDVSERGSTLAHLAVAISLACPCHLLARLGMASSIELPPALIGAAICVIVFLNRSIF